MRALRFSTLMVAALSLTAESAHVLELPQKLAYDPVTYTLVNGTLYKWFAIVGGSYQVLSIVLAVASTVAVRRQRAVARWTAAGALGLAAAFAVWAAVVQPVNRQIATLFSTDPGAVPAAWEHLRDRWEYGHAAGFAVQLLGFGALVASALVGR